MYDFLIVGSGLFGSVFANQATKYGKKCLVIDKRNHSGGNIFCENICDINVHKYGPHIFHTNDKRIWQFVNKYCDFNRFTYSPLAKFEEEIYNLPFNMNTFNQMWGVTTPEEAKEKIFQQVKASGIKNPKNLEEQAISMVGEDIYFKLIKGYTEKQWGRSAKDLPKFIIKRLPVRYTYDNNYFNDLYQGIPIGGYNVLTESLLDGIEVQLNTDFFKNRIKLESISKNIVFTGAIDEFYEYRFGMLQYRSLRFDSQILEKENFQGVAGVNYTDSHTKFTRIIEHKFFENKKSSKTVITKEYPQIWDLSKERYYPINDELNNSLFKKYREIANTEKNVIFGGRLAEYKYYDMHQVIASALSKSKRIFGETR